jgi:hypothetical protein
MRKTVTKDRIKVVRKVIKEAIMEAFEDIGMIKAIEEGLKTKRVSKKEIFELLNKNI